MSEVYRLLRSHRERGGTTLRELAPRVGVAFSTLGQYELGQVDVPLSKLHAWAAALDLRIDMLLRRAAEPQLVGLSDDQRALLRTVTAKVSALSDIECRMLVGQIELLSGSSKDT